MRHTPLARFTAAAILFSVGLISSFAAQTAAKQSGKAAQNTTQSNGVRLPEVHLDGAYFTRDGKRFIPMGAHWVPAKTAMQWPVQWDPKDIEADFAKMHELGYSIVRLDVMWAWFEPRPGDYNPVAFQQLDYLVSLAHKYQIYLHPSLFIGGEVGGAYWDVPWRHGRHPHADPEAMPSARGKYAPPFEGTRSPGAGRPVMIHEMGASTAQFSPERIASYDRAQTYSGIGAGSSGLDPWCYPDASPEQFHKVPYLRTPQETGWGMTSWDRQDKPLAREFKKFSEVVGQLDLTGIAPAPADIGIVIHDEWAKAHGDFSYFGLADTAGTPC